MAITVVRRPDWTDALPEVGQSIARGMEKAQAAPQEQLRSAIELQQLTGVALSPEEYKRVFPHLANKMPHDAYVEAMKGAVTQREQFALTERLSRAQIDKLVADTGLTKKQLENFDAAFRLELDKLDIQVQTLGLTRQQTIHEIALKYKALESANLDREQQRALAVWSTTVDLQFRSLLREDQWTQHAQTLSATEKNQAVERLELMLKVGESAAEILKKWGKKNIDQLPNEMKGLLSWTLGMAEALGRDAEDGRLGVGADTVSRWSRAGKAVTEAMSGAEGTIFSENYKAGVHAVNQKAAELRVPRLLSHLGIQQLAGVHVGVSRALAMTTARFLKSVAQPYTMEVPPADPGPPPSPILPEPTAPQALPQPNSVTFPNFHINPALIPGTHAVDTVQPDTEELAKQLGFLPLGTFSSRPRR